MVYVSFQKFRTLLSTLSPQRVTPMLFCGSLVLFSLSSTPETLPLHSLVSQQNPLYTHPLSRKLTFLLRNILSFVFLKMQPWFLPITNTAGLQRRDALSSSSSPLPDHSTSFLPNNTQLRISCQQILPPTASPCGSHLLTPCHSSSFLEDFNSWFLSSSSGLFQS